MYLEMESCDGCNLLSSDQREKEKLKAVNVKELVNPWEGYIDI